MLKNVNYVITSVVTSYRHPCILIHSSLCTGTGIYIYKYVYTTLTPCKVDVLTKPSAPSTNSNDHYDFHYQDIK